MKESQIQRQIIEYLIADGWMVVKHIQTNLNGFPDLQALKNGRCVFIEVKSCKGKLRPLQIHRLNHLLLQSFQIIVTSNLNQFINELLTNCSTQLPDIGTVSDPDK